MNTLVLTGFWHKVMVQEGYPPKWADHPYRERKPDMALSSTRKVRRYELWGLRYNESWWWIPRGARKAEPWNEVDLVTCVTE